jgi:hypothetical protein
MSRCLWHLGDRNVAETVSSGRGRERPDPLHCRHILPLTEGQLRVRQQSLSLGSFERRLGCSSERPNVPLWLGGAACERTITCRTTEPSMPVPTDFSECVTFNGTRVLVTSIGILRDKERFARAGLTSPKSEIRKISSGHSKFRSTSKCTAFSSCKRESRNAKADALEWGTAEGVVAGR